MADHDGATYGGRHGEATYGGPWGSHVRPIMGKLRKVAHWEPRMAAYGAARKVDHDGATYGG